MENLSGEWRIHNGRFSQSINDSGRMRPKLTNNNGQAENGLQHAEQLFDFSSIFTSASHVPGIERLWNLNNMAYSAEFYLYAKPEDVGQAAEDLATGGKKRVKAARARATVSLRAKWHSANGEFWNYTLNGGTKGKSYEGWVELYDPDQFKVRKLDINEVRDWSEGIEHRIHAVYREWADKEMDKPVMQRADFLPYSTYLGRTMYAAHVLRERYLSLEVLIAVMCRVADFDKAMEILEALPSATQFADFDWRRIQLLYT